MPRPRKYLPLVRYLAGLPREQLAVTLTFAELEQLVGRQAYELAILKKVSRMYPGLPSSNGRSS